MNNMHFDETTQTWRGVAEPYLLSPEQDPAIGQHKPWLLDALDSPANALVGYYKPLPVSAQWVAQSQWEMLWNPSLQGSAAMLTNKPEHWLLAQAQTDGAVQQLVQAMAAFAAPAYGAAHPEAPASHGLTPTLAVDYGFA